MIAADWTEGKSVDVTTHSGVALHIRRYQAGDKEAMFAFFQGVAAADRTFRFPDTEGEVGSLELASLEAPATSLVAYNDDGLLVASSTLTPIEREGTADVAVSVLEPWKARGLSWSLLETTLDLARQAGFRRVTATEIGADHDAINLAHRMGFATRLVSADPVLLSLTWTIDA
ncbi:GNAT family N-acetyltransferase [Sphingomonas sp. AP4-R1]|uniref:GNAT family N-acetyltransferase n=1 Tax=Sphingomonas sp. AP4-R1 TaxID=2735134 RepID=UPI0020A34FC9|nr:GNAT family N-acetyltransferase [Sphingomonas sp. AP4-R1]